MNITWLNRKQQAPACSKKNILDYLTDIKHSVLAIKYIKLYPREIHPLYFDEANNLYYLTEKDANNGGIAYEAKDLAN